MSKSPYSVLYPRECQVSRTLLSVFWRFLPLLLLLFGAQRASGQIVINITTTSPSCAKSLAPSLYFKGNGVINVTASGGVAPYLYTLQGQTLPQNNGYFPGLIGDTYTVVVTDATGASANQTVTLTNTLPQPLVRASAIQLPTSCTNADGILTAVGSGGTTPYQYSIDGGTTFTSNPVFPNLTQGYYVVQLKDANGCLATGGTSSANTLNNYFFCNNCCSLNPDIGLGSELACTNDGIADVWATGGQMPYQYSLDNTNFVTPANPDPNNNNFYTYEYTDLVSGLYHAYVKDAAGSTATIGFSIEQSCSIQLTFVYVAASCHQSDGAITAIAAKGQTPYSYTIDGANYQASNVFSNLASGNYSVTVRDATGQTSSATATINNKCPTVTAIATDETCGQGDGVIVATGALGTQPYQFSIDNGTTYQSSNTFNNLHAGNYTVTLKDAGNFTSTTTVPVKNNCLQLTLTFQGTTCGNSNGSITALGSNGTAPFSYSLDGTIFQTGNVFSNLAAGLYTVTMKDLNGLSTSSVAVLVDAPGPQLQVTNTPASCQNTNGSITLTATGGASSLQYSIDGGTTYQPGNVFNGLDSGQYSLFVQDVNGCKASQTIDLTALPTPEVSLGNDTTLCTGKTLLLTAPQAPGYQYQWQNASSAADYLVDVPGQYSVKVTNASNCSAVASIQVYFKPVPVFTLGNDTSLCNGKTLLLQPSVGGGSGGGGPFQPDYLWSTGSTGTSLLVNSPGQYSLQVSNAGCALTQTITVTYNPNPVLDLGPDTTLCAGHTVLLDATNTNATYLWQDGSVQPLFTVNQQGVYSVKVTKEGCDTSGSIGVNYLTKPLVPWAADTTLCVTQTLLLDASYPQSTYAWQDGSAGPSYTVTQAGVYTVNVTNQCGVTAASIQVEYDNCACKFYVPSGFSPNGDGNNDVFRPKYICLFSNYTLQVYNRWGQLVFSSRNPADGWDGMMGAQPQPTGVYVWKMGYKDDLTGKTSYKTGTVILVR